MCSTAPKQPECGRYPAWPSAVHKAPQAPITTNRPRAGRRRRWRPRSPPRRTQLEAGTRTGLSSASIKSSSCGDRDGRIDRGRLRHSCARLSRRSAWGSPLPRDPKRDGCVAKVVNAQRHGGRLPFNNGTSAKSLPDPSPTREHRQRPVEQTRPQTSANSPLTQRRIRSVSLLVVCQRVV